MNIKIMNHSIIGLMNTFLKFSIPTAFGSGSSPSSSGRTRGACSANCSRFSSSSFSLSTAMILAFSAFDIAAMKQLLVPHGVMPELHHVVLDTSPLGYLTVGKYRSNDLFEMFIGGRADTHDALDDARMTLTVARTIRQLMNEALGSLG